MSDNKTRDEFDKNLPKSMDQKLIRNVESAIPKRRWGEATFIALRYVLWGLVILSAI